jgi:hypothetical protein|tara:strand:+ start:947 stop:1105 length:159 start_codon:yes stop_codon:yes gene_type:complete
VYKNTSGISIPLDDDAPECCDRSIKVSGLGPSFDPSAAAVSFYFEPLEDILI